MATIPLFVERTAGQTVYFTLWNSAGQVFDFDDNTFKAVGSAVTPALAATERTGPGGSVSHYTANLDLADVHMGGNVLRLWVAAFQQVGGSPAPATDTTLTIPESQRLLDIQFAEQGIGQLRLEVAPAFTTTAGLEMRLRAALTRNGVKVPLETYDAAATLALAVREQGAGSDLFTISATTVGADGLFDLDQADPEFTSDRVYSFIYTLVENGNTHTFVEMFPVHG